jgi:arylsulfatase A-like enzyme
MHLKIVRPYPLALLMHALAACADMPTEEPTSSVQEPAPVAESGQGLREKQELSDVRAHAAELLAQSIESSAKLSIVFVLDGLRPDSINSVDTPNLFFLRETGVKMENGHAVFPTVTRVNSPSIATGYYPGTAGVVSNSIYVPEIDPTGDISTGEVANLRKLDEVSGGRLVFVKTLAERLQEAGKTLAAVSSGSSGSAYLLNPRAERGVGVLVNRDLGTAEAPRVAYPDAANEAILARFGTRSGPDSTVESTNWAENVLREYVIPELKPDVILNWITQPDGTQHEHGAGSPEALETIRNDDRHIGLILAKLEQLGLYEQTNIIVVSDHGFGVHTFGVNLDQSLIDAGLKAALDSDDVVTASSSHTALIHVKNRDARRIAAIVKHLQAQPWSGLLFTRAPFGGKGASPNPHGWLPGTFSLELIYQANEERGADIVLTFDWSSQENAFGIEGTDTTLASATGPLTTNASGHGSMSPWTVRNTWLAWGADFKDRVVDRVPASNVDITPTLLALHGLPAGGLDGRVLREAIEGGVDYEKVPLETKSYVAGTRGGYRALIQVTEVAHQRYIDKGWRLK